MARRAPRRPVGMFYSDKETACRLDPDRLRSYIGCRHTGIRPLDQMPCSSMSKQMSMCGIQQDTRLYVYLEAWIYDDWAYLTSGILGLR